MSSRGRRGGADSSLLGLIAVLTSLPRFPLMSAVVVLVGVIGAGDYATGPDASFSVLYLVPVFLSAAVTRGAGVAISGATAATWSLIETELRSTSYGQVWLPVWNLLSRFWVLALIAVLVSALAGKLANESRLSRTDALTGLLNGRGFHETVDAEIHRMRRMGVPLTTAYIDIDGFKAINDRHGHLAGDRILTVAAQTMTSVMRDTDRVARLGGDEFAILLPGTGVQDARAILGRLHTSLHTATSTYGFRIGFSIGAATFTEPPDSGQQLVESADQVMYKAKRNGKDKVVCMPMLDASDRSWMRSAGASTG